jgi:hypothetical protein
MRTELHHVEHAWAAICAEATKLIAARDRGSHSNQAASGRE